MELDILFLGRLFPREKEAEIKAKMKTGMQDAANALQWNIIDGLEANDCGRIKILNYLPIDSYPRGYTDSRIEQFAFAHTDRYAAEDLNVGCTNRSIVKQFVNIRPFKREVKRWVRRRDGAKKVLVAYTASAMFLSLAKYAKRLDPTVETCCIIADIPEFASARHLTGVRKLYNTYLTNRCAALYEHIDKFVLLTRQMADKLRIKAPFIVIEGIAPTVGTVRDSALSDQYKGEKYILYSGTLNCQFGIIELLDAFETIPDRDVRLMICGFGEAETIIRERMTKDARIIFPGRVDRAEVLALQRGAAVLVNPRQNNEEFTKYSFPSKTMEYLSSGVPLVAYKLDGIPDEYDDYIHYVPDNSPASLTGEISYVLGMSAEEREKFGAEARRFVTENKNNVVQGKKILDFIR